MKKKIILASASPRRRELLTQIGVEFEVRVSMREEIYHGSEPEMIVKELAMAKAENVLEEFREEVREKEDGDGAVRDTIVIGADTVVVLDGQILGKPGDSRDACRMLKMLQGRPHDVYTGVAVLSFDENGEKKVYSSAVRTRVYVHDMTEEEIRTYTASGEPLDKAGAYGIQGAFAAFIDRIDGDYYNVVGLPVSCVYQILKEAGYTEFHRESPL